MGFQIKPHALLLILALLALSSACLADNIGTAKRDIQDNALVSIQGSVTAVFTGKIYVENSTGIQGIRVDTSKTFALGTIVNVNGVMKTDLSTQERYILADAAYPQPAGGTLVMAPRGMAPTALVGGDFGFQRGISGVSGLNNIGLLVKVCGPVSSFDDPLHPSSWFKMNSAVGPEIKIVVPSGVSLDIDWTQVTVTGICSSEIVNGVMTRVINVRQASDIVCYQSWADNKVATMTVDQKVGQLFQIRVNGNYSMTTADYTAIQTQRVGGFIYFANNFNGSASQAASLSNALQTTAMGAGGIPLLISMDQEGGMVTRIEDGCSMPGNMAIGASRSYDIAYTAGNTIGSEVHAVGGNMDLAPDLDCNTNWQNPIIGVRSFSADPDITTNMGHGYIDGLHNAGVIATGKHFPGHGDTATDSHTGLPVVTYNFTTLDTIHAKPFKNSIANGIDCIMTAHIIATCLDSTLPATLSPTVLTGYLRGTIGFNGVCMTDGMGMGALSNLGYSNDQECVMAIQAGNDLISLPINFTTALAAMKAAVTSGQISQARLDQSVARILRLKRKYGLFTNPYVDTNAAGSIVGSADHKASELSVARAGITLVKNASNILPLNLAPTDQLFVVVCNDSTAADGTSLDFHLANYLSTYHPNVGNVWVTANPNSYARGVVLNDVKNCSTVVVATIDANNNSGQRTLITQLVSAGKKVICIGQDGPYEYSGISGCNAYMCAYWYNDCNLQAAADVIFGGFHPIGLLPVALPSTSYGIGWGLSF